MAVGLEVGDGEGNVAGGGVGFGVVVEVDGVGVR